MKAGWNSSRQQHKYTLRKRRRITNEKYDARAQSRAENSGYHVISILPEINRNSRIKINNNWMNYRNSLELHIELLKLRQLWKLIYQNDEKRRIHFRFSIATKFVIWIALTMNIREWLLCISFLLATIRKYAPVWKSRNMSNNHSQKSRFSLIFHHSFPGVVTSSQNFWTLC